MIVWREDTELMGITNDKAYQRWLSETFELLSSSVNYSSEVPLLDAKKTAWPILSAPVDGSGA